MTNVRVVTAAGVLSSREAETALGERSLYKALSLFLGDTAGLNVLPTLVLIEKNAKAAGDFLAENGSPVMMRYDYTRLPRKKYLGGIPLRGKRIIGKVCRFFHNERLFPMLHRNVDRSRNRYNVGALVREGEDEVLIEVVGKGFDASDLRHGRSIPHETFCYDLSRGRISQHETIRQDSYDRAVPKRLNYLDSLLRYFDIINESGEVMAKGDIESLDPGPVRANRLDIPDSYEPLPPDDRAALLRGIRVACDGVLPFLPRSSNYTLSFSLIDDCGWVFWDIYGAWYAR